MKIKLLILTSMLISFGIKSQNVIDMPYEFPVKPGTEKWSSFKTGKEMPVDIKTKQTSSKIKDNAPILHLAYLELLLSNDTFFKHFTSKEFTKLKEITLEKYERKLANKNTYSLYSIEKTLLLGAKVLEKTKNETLSADKKVKISKFITEFGTSNSELTQEISKFIYE